MIEIILFTSIPTRADMILSWEVARIAFPILVNLMRMVKKTMTQNVVARITSSGEEMIWA